MDWLEASAESFDGVVLEAGGLHTPPWRLREHRGGHREPVVEVHMSDIHAARPFARNPTSRRLSSGRSRGSARVLRSWTSEQSPRI